MAKKVEFYFFFMLDSQHKKLTTKLSLKRQLKFYGTFLSNMVKIPKEYMLIQPSKKARPIGLLEELEHTVLELVEEYGTSFDVYNLLEEPIELYFTTKSVHKNRWNTQFNKAKREKSFRDLLPELVEWSGYPITDMRFITVSDDNPIELLKEDYDLKIPELVAKYGSGFTLESISWNSW